MSWKHGLGDSGKRIEESRPNTKVFSRIKKQDDVQGTRDDHKGTYLEILPPAIEMRQQCPASRSDLFRTKPHPAERAYYQWMNSFEMAFCNLQSQLKLESPRDGALTYMYLYRGIGEATGHPKSSYTFSVSWSSLKVVFPVPYCETSKSLPKRRQAIITDQAHAIPGTEEHTSTVEYSTPSLFIASVYDKREFVGNSASRMS
ncbi:hypothetical protein IW261DRAFT_1419892 [Armillaria novae-zelandiae]|uniref:Uncharacterized protein n=1 Tax=Armillaria novae-zelandiae TaxID=153914 RepID=A0AA39P896_9AGAR|nr:hypothetical protein IW261DRAFT_1419892 [Armillaria novae-zelandiae]